MFNNTYFYNVKYWHDNRCMFAHGVVSDSSALKAYNSIPSKIEQKHNFKGVSAINIKTFNKV